MDLTCTFLKGNHRNVHGVSVIGCNKTSDGDVVWMFSPSTQLDEDGNWIQSNTSQFVWLPSDLCYHPYLVPMLFANLLSLHLVTF